MRRKVDGVRFFGLRRRTFVAAAIVLPLLLIVGGYAAWSFNQWSTIDKRANEVGSLVRVDIERLGQEGVSTDDLRGVISQLSGRIDSLCEVSPLVDWQSELIENLKSRMDSCLKIRDEVSATEGALGDIESYLSWDEGVSSLVRQLEVRLREIEGGDVVDRLAAWTDFKSDLEEIESPEGVAVDIITSIDVIIEGYSGLLKAGEAESRADYDQALAALVSGYDQFHEVSVSLSGGMSELLRSLEEAVKPL